MTGQEYLEQHGITEKFAKEFGITWNDKTLDIPIKDAKKTWYKHRNLDYDTDDDASTKYTNDQGSKATIFNLKRNEEETILILTEGEMDAVKLTQEGIPAISVTSGAEKFDKHFAEKLQGKEIIICYDNDSAGKAGTQKVLSYLPEAKVLPLPQAVKDIGEFFYFGGTKKNFQNIKPLTADEWLIKNDPEEFNIISGESLLGLNIPKEEWLIDRIIPSEGFTFIVGAEATGKSFLTLTLAEAITTGNDWLGHFKVKKQTNVLFIDKENTKRRTQSRLRGLNIKGEGMFWLQYPAFFELNNDKEDDGFSQFVKSIQRQVKRNNIGLIILDSFADIMVGNENAAADTQKFFDGFRQLFPGVSIVVLHHENKPQQGTQRTSSQRFRGSTNITAQIVVGFRMEATKDKSEFTMEQTKAGDAERLNKFKIKMVTSLDVSDITKTIVKELSYGGEVSSELMAVDKAAEFITDYLENHPDVCRQDIINAGFIQGETKSAIVRALDMLKEKHIIYSKPDPYNKRKRVFSMLEDLSEDPNSIFNGEVDISPND